MRSHGLAGLTAGARADRRSGRTVLGRTVSAAGRLRHGNARRAGHRAERPRRQRLADPAAVQDWCCSTGRTARRSPSISYQSVRADLATLDAEARTAAPRRRRVIRSTTGEGGARRGARSCAVLREDAAAARDAWQAMADVLDEKAGADGPPPRRCATCWRDHRRRQRSTRRTLRRRPRRGAEGSGETADSGAAPGGRRSRPYRGVARAGCLA